MPQFWKRLQRQFEVKDQQIEQQKQAITRLTDALVAAQQTAAAAQALHAGDLAAVFRRRSRDRSTDP